MKKKGRHSTTLTFPKDPCPSTFRSSKCEGSAFITLEELLTIAVMSNSEESSAGSLAEG